MLAQLQDSAPNASESAREPIPSSALTRHYAYITIPRVLVTFRIHKCSFEICVQPQLHYFFFFTLATAMPTPSASIQTMPQASSPSRSSSYHPYLEPTRASSIESWNLSVPGRSIQAHAQRQQPSVSDPAILAYLQVKMALLRRKTGS